MDQPWPTPRDDAPSSGELASKKLFVPPNSWLPPVLRGRSVWIAVGWIVFIALPCWPQKNNWFFNSFGWSAQPANYVAGPLLGLVVGLVLTWRFCREVLWRRPLRGLMASGTLLVSGLLSILFLYRVMEVILHGSFNVSLTILFHLTWLAFVTELWFRGLWPALLPSRAWGLALANALLSGSWYMAWVGQWSGLPITTDRGWQNAVLEAALGLLLWVLRGRGVSLYLLTLVSVLLNFVFFAFNLNDYDPRFAFGGSLLRYAPAYLLLLGALLVVPVGWRGERRLIAWAKFVPLCLLGLVVATLPYLATRHEPRWQLGKNATAQARWQADLDYLGQEFPRRQLDFPNKDTRGGWAQELARLRAQAGQVPDATMVAGVTHLIARLGVGHAHTNTITAQPGLHYWPLEMRWCADGLMVVGVGSGQPSSWIGAQVFRIGDYTPEDAEARMMPYIAHEQMSWVHYLMEHDGLWADMMQAAGLVAPDGTLHLQLALLRGGTTEAVLSSNDKAVGASIETPELPFDTPPGPYRAYFTRQGPKTLYIRYDANADEPESPAGPFERFVRDTFARADRDGVDRLVVDLRFNHGGAMDAMAPLLQAVRSRPVFRGSEHLLVLIGSGTFSAAVFDAVAFRDAFGAILLGESTGGLLTTYAETHFLALPNSKLQVGYATMLSTCRYWRPGPLLPDRPVRAATIAEYVARQDPVYQAAVSEKPPTP